MFNRHWIRVGTIALIATAAGLARAAEKEEGERKFALKDCPVAVQKAIAEQAGKATVVSIERSVEGVDVEFDVTVKLEGGKERELFLGGDGQFRAWEDKVELKDCPPKVQKMIREKTGKLPVVEIVKETYDDGVEYSVTVKRDGREREFSVAVDGEFLDWEGEDVELKDCPPAVQKTIKENTAGATIEGIEDFVEEFAVDIKQGDKERTLYVGAGGKLRSWEESVELKDCPPAVQAMIKTKTGDGAVVEITRETEGKKVEYSVTIQVERDFTVDATGKFLGWDDE